MRHRLDAETAAIVGERPIRRIDYERMLAGVEQDRRGPIDDGTRRRVLERMIDEELLVQQALALGIAQVDRRVRGELVSSLIDSVVSEADSEPPSKTEIEGHYRENAAFFARPGRLRVESLYFSAAGGAGANGDSARGRAEAARRRLVGGAEFAAVSAEAADRAALEVPAALLPLAKLRDYLGPAAIESLASMAPGEWSAPLEAAGGFRLVRLLEREPESTPPLAEIEALVREDLVRRRGDEALRRYLDSLREEIDVLRNAALFIAPRAGIGDESDASP